MMLLIMDYKDSSDYKKGFSIMKSIEIVKKKY